MRYYWKLPWFSFNEITDRRWDWKPVFLCHWRGFRMNSPSVTCNFSWIGWFSQSGLLAFTRVTEFRREFWFWVTFAWCIRGNICLQASWRWFGLLRRLWMKWRGELSGKPMKLCKARCCAWCWAWIDGSIWYWGDFNPSMMLSSIFSWFSKVLVPWNRCWNCVRICCNFF